MSNDQIGGVDGAGVDGAGTIQAGISQAPVNVLFNTSGIAKRDVWEIDLIGILEMLIRILEKSGKKDLRVAGMAALSSSLIYRMKVESIFALQKAAMSKKPMPQRRDVSIEMINIPYRHESTYPVTLNELLGLLESLIGSIANPQSRRGGRISFEPVETPDFEDYFISLENIIGKYEDLIIKKITPSGEGMLQKIIEGLDATDSIRCFFAVLFMARDERVDLEQADDDIRITLVTPQAQPSKSGGAGHREEDRPDSHDGRSQ